MGEILFKIHKSYRLVVAICDKDIYGRKLVEGNNALDLTGPFFEGDEVDEAELKIKIIDFAKEDATFNIVGEKSIRVAKEVEIIESAGVMEIEGVPFDVAKEALRIGGQKFPVKTKFIVRRDFDHK